MSGIDHGRVNMRTNTPQMFGDAFTQAQYERECEEVRSRMTCRFAVAPRQQVITPNGLVIKAGEEVTVSQLHGGQQAAWRVLEGWVASGRVLESNSPVLTGADKGAKHRVAPGISITTLAGILGSGRAVTAADLEDGADGLANLVARGAVVAK